MNAYQTAEMYRNAFGDNAFTLDEAAEFEANYDVVGLDELMQAGFVDWVSPDVEVCDTLTPQEFAAYVNNNDTTHDCYHHYMGLRQWRINEDGNFELIEVFCTTYQLC